MSNPQGVAHLVNALWPGAWDNDDAQAPLVPCKNKDKVPLISWKNYQDKPPVISQIKKWAADYPGCNWALLTGRTSGIVVLDMDDYDLAMDWMRQSMIEEPKTIMAQTSPNQFHYYLQWPGQICGNFAKKIPGFDFRGDGGYVIAPGSIHPKGHRYQWVQGYSPGMQDLAPCPPWLLELLFGEKVNPLPVAAHDPEIFCTISIMGQDIDIPMSEYEKRLIDALAAGVSKGSRNQTGFCIGVYLLDIGVSFNDMRLALISWNDRCTPSMKEKEILALPLNVQKYWDRKRHMQKHQRQVSSGEGRKRGIEELSSFLGVEIVDVYQTPNENKTITILAKDRGGMTKTSVHNQITGFRAWSSEFSRQTLIVPNMPDKISQQFNNDFMLLLYSVARIGKLLEGGTKESQIRQAIHRMAESGLALGRDATAVYRDRRGVTCFGAFSEDGKIVFHVFQLKDFVSQITTDLITDRELAMILTDLGCEMKTLLILERRTRAWLVDQGLYI